MAAARLQELLALLQQEEYRTAQQLARHLDVSEKTVRIRLRELHAELAGHGAGIMSKARYGYRLEVTDPVAFEIWQKEEGNVRRECQMSPGSVPCAVQTQSGRELLEARSLEDE